MAKERRARGVPDFAFHGTLRGYHTYGCRKACCRIANTLKKREYRDRVARRRS